MDGGGLGEQDAPSSIMDLMADAGYGSVAQSHLPPAPLPATATPSVIIPSMSLQQQQPPPQPQPLQQQQQQQPPQQYSRPTSNVMPPRPSLSTSALTPPEDPTLHARNRRSQAPDSSNTGHQDKRRRTTAASGYLNIPQVNSTTQQPATLSSTSSSTNPPANTSNSMATPSGGQQPAPTAVPPSAPTDSVSGCSSACIPGPRAMLTRP